MIGAGRVDLDELRARWPLPVLAEHYGVQLRGRGHRLYGRCPFHDDRTPSLVIYPESQSFFCFGCRAWGDAIDWVQRLDGLTFQEACRALGGTPYPARRPVRRSEVPRGAFDDGLPGWALQVLQAAADIYRQALRRSPEAFSYLRRRGIAAPAVRVAGPGYATGRDLARGLSERGLATAAAADLGLLNPQGREILSGRLVVPVVCERKVVTLTGRAILPHLRTRYVSLPLPPHAMGVDLVRGERRPVLVEGVSDFLVAVGWGYPAISPMGSHASSAVRDEILAATGTAAVVVLALDDDPAGQEARALWQEALGNRAAPVTWPTGVNDVGDLGPRPDGRRVFAALVAAAEARWRSRRAA